MKFNQREKNLFIFLWGGLLGSVFTFISMNLFAEGSYQYIPSPWNHSPVSSLRLEKGGSSRKWFVGITRNANDVSDRHGYGTEFHVTAALFSGHDTWVNSGKRLYRTVRCPKINAEMTINNAMGNVTATMGANVVMFAGRGVEPEKWKQLMAARSEEQIWLYSSEESIYHSPPVPGFPKMVIRNLKFNMTYGYHRDSDISQGFGKINRRRKIKADLFEAIDPKPSNLPPVAWMSSRDHMYWNRSRFVHELSKYLQIDTFGKLGDVVLPRRPKRDDNSTLVLKRYKFYLSLENSCCSDYITEKFWVALASYQAVPIVVGPPKVDYERVAPPNSFIYADDYDSMESLADYVTEVSSDPDLYAEFHQWRKDYDVITYTPRDMYPFQEDDKVCLTLKFLRDHGWRKDRPLKGMDPYGKKWLRSCASCGKHNWLADYDIDCKTYTRDLERNIGRPP